MWKYYEKKFKKKYINRENIGANLKKNENLYSHIISIKVSFFFHNKLADTFNITFIDNKYLETQFFLDIR